MPRLCEEEFANTTMMTSTSLTALYQSYGLKPCRVILERLSALEAVQTPAPAEPRKAPQTRVKPLKLRNGETRSSLSRKKPSKVAPKATTRLRDPTGSPSNKEVTSEEPAEKALSDVDLGACQTTETLRDRPTQVVWKHSRKRRAHTPSSLGCPPLENLPCDREAKNASWSTEKKKETCDPAVATRQSEIVATNARRSRCCRVTRSNPGGWRDATPAVDVPSCSGAFPSNILEESDKDNRTSEEAAVINQPPEIAKFLKRRRSQPSRILPRKFPAFAPPLQACARLEELSCNHVSDSEKEKETEDAVTSTPRSSRIHTKVAGQARRSFSRMEYSLAPALQDGASVEVFFGERMGDSEKKEAAIQASSAPKARKTRRNTPRWRHGLIRRRRSRRKLPLTPPASAVPLGHSEEHLVDPADGSASEHPAEEILGIDPMAEETIEETAVMKLGDHLEEKQLPSDTRPEEQQTERGDHQTGTLEPPAAVQGVIDQLAAKQLSAEATESELGVQERERPAELVDQSAEGGSRRAGEEPGDQPVPTSQESQAKAEGLNRRRRGRPKGLRVSRARGIGQQRRCGGSARVAIGAEAAADIVHLPAVEEAVPLEAVPVQKTSLVGTYVEESVTAMSLDDVVADQGDVLVSLGEEQWAIISGEVVEPRPTRELYLERQDIPPMTQASNGKRKRGRRRKSKLTAPKRRGRPPKNPPAEPKKRGRPRKDSSAVPPVKCRGRPRKNVSLTAPKRRGRPPKNAPQARESKGTWGRQPTSTPASSTGKRRPGRPRKERGVVAWIDPCSPEQDCAVVPWNPALGGDGDGDDSGWETTSNVSFYSSVWHFDRYFESSDDDRPARKKMSQKRRGTRKTASTEAQPPRKRGRPRKNPLKAAGSSKETSARGRATRGMKTPCPWNESASLTLAKFRGESPPALPYDSDDNAGDAESDWETCSNVSIATIDANFEDMLLPGVDFDWPGPSRLQEQAGFFPAIQGGELQRICESEPEESLVHFIDGEALSEDWETTSNASSGWNTELDAMLIPTDDSAHSGNYIVTEPEDEFMTCEELQSAFPQDEHGHSPVFLGNSSPTEGSPEPYVVAEPVDDDEAGEVPQEAVVDLECRDDRAERATAFAGVGESDQERDVVVLPSEGSDGAGGDAPSELSIIAVFDSDATDSVCDSMAEHDSGIEAPVPPGIGAAGGSAPEIIEISDDDSDRDDGSSSQSAAPLAPSTEEVAGVEVPMETPALADTQTYTNTEIPPPASSDATKDVQSLGDALCKAACDIPSPAGARPRANASASGGPKDIEADPDYSPVVSDLEDDDVDHQELELGSKNLDGGSTASVAAQSPLQSHLADSEGDEVDGMSDFDVCSHVSSMYCAWNSDLDARSVSSCRGAVTSDVSGAEMSEWESTSVRSHWTDFDAMLTSDSESEDGKGGREAGTRQAAVRKRRSKAKKTCTYSEEPGELRRGARGENGAEDFVQVSESEEDVRSTRRKQGRPRKTRPLYVERKRYSDDDDDDDDYFPAGNESISDPGTSEADLGSPKRRRPGRPRKAPFLPPELIEALTRDSGSDYDAETQFSAEDEEEETNPDETSQQTEAEARQRDVQRNLRIAPFPLLNQPPKRRRGNKRRKDAERDPDYELPEPEYEPANESLDEANYTFRRGSTRSPKNIQNEELDELSCPESGPENASDDKPQVSTTFSAMECKEALHDELFCDECGVDHPGDCPIHGPLIYVKDTQVPKGAPLRANKTLPEGLDIRRSAMRGAQFGVFAMKPLAKRTCFGPYEGVRRRTNRGNGYTWKVYGRNGEAYMVDARPLEQSNWMRYVNCSPTEDQQNLVAFQRNGNVYFRTLRDIDACEELVVWYGNSFAKDLGLIDYKGQSSEPKTPDPARRRIFKCDSCNDAFSLRKCLLSHKLRHHVKKSPGRFECRLCPYSCQTRWVIKRHVLIHTKHKPFKCQYCDKGFTQRGSLKIHQRIHTDERPFECSTCGQRFRDPSVLSRHQNLHTGHSKVHACPVCGRPFSLKSDVKRHMRTHTGERPYKCTICAKPFRDLGHWRRHERLVHSKKYTLHCPFCGKGAAAMWNLRQHLRARHRSDKRDEPTDTEDGNASGDDVKRESDNVEKTVTEGTEAAARNAETATVDGKEATVDEKVMIKDGGTATEDAKIQPDV